MAAATLDCATVITAKVLNKPEELTFLPSNDTNEKNAIIQN